MTEPKPATDEIAALIERVDRAAAAYIQGNIREYFELTPHTTDFTLMPPYGGEPTVLGDTRTDQEIEVTSRYFRGGTARWEAAQTLVSRDMVVLVGIERQHGDVGEFPAQDWSLRVTQVFLRQDGQWKLAHRHADALVHPIPMDRMAALARGDGSADPSDGL
jgi:ketosteroid isomerase-like protein